MRSSQSVSEDSPAAAAGLKVDDTIVAIDGDAVGGAESLTAYVRALPSDTKVALTVVRDGKTSEVDVTLAVRPVTTESTPQQDQQDQQDQQGSGVPDGPHPRPAVAVVPAAAAGSGPALIR